jgi:hypothetical protein
MATLTRTKRPSPRCGRSIRAQNWHVYRFLRAFSSAGPAESRSWHLGSTIGTFRRVVQSADPSRSWHAGDSVYSLRPICLHDFIPLFSLRRISCWSPCQAHVRAFSRLCDVRASPLRNFFH